MPIENPAPAERSLDRRTQRRLDTESEILDIALEIMSSEGVAGLTMTRLAERMGLKPPSLYRYYVSLMAIHDALFRRGQLANLAVVQAAMETAAPGLDAAMAAMTAAGKWAVENPTLAKLLFWRPVPRFEPTADAFAPTVEIVALLRDALSHAVNSGHLHPDAASDQGMDLLSILHFGVITQHLANDVHGTWESGRYTSLHHQVIDMFLAAYPGPNQSTGRVDN
jgi:AcrR family transcriptional regulator